jgi:holin-like protein
MKTLTGFAVLLCTQSAGELLARVAKVNLGATLPGPVWGMLLLLALLLLPWVQRYLAPSVGQASTALLAHLSLLFVPVGVGVMAHLGLLSQYGWKLAVVLLVPTWLGLAATALVLRALMPTKSLSSVAIPVTPQAEKVHQP